MLNSSSGFDASGFIRKFSLRKKRWPDDYVTPPQTQGSKQGGTAGLYRKRIGSNSPSSPPSSPPYSPSTSPRITFSPPQPLTTLAFSELRTQFADQIKCLDSKLDLDVTVMVELHEFYRRRALVEQEYSDALAKLVNSLKHKHSNETGK
ncbi:unnamed protein product [Hymenolepis diminuta]|uniref:FCH domain-containing protein n=1 Tax=Hymenolepis diminuta TaxID=6216 RepID=A0A0R3SHS6_HYMDI|nr:unnamed protein product [Hymenolepis diminuta]